MKAIVVPDGGDVMAELMASAGFDKNYSLTLEDNDDGSQNAHSNGDYAP